LTIKLTQHVPIRSGAGPRGTRGRRILRSPIRILQGAVHRAFVGLQRRPETHRASSELAFPQIALLEQNLQLARGAHTS